MYGGTDIQNCVCLGILLLGTNIQKITANTDAVFKSKYSTPTKCKTATRYKGHVGLPCNQ